MAHLLSPLLVFQRFIIPTILVLLVWGIWRVLFKKDLAIGMALYLALVVVVDGFYNTGIYLPGLAQGSIRYSEVCALILLFTHKRQPEREPIRKTVVVLSFIYFTLMFVAALRAQPMLAGIFDFRKIIFPSIVAFTLGMRGLPSMEEYRRFLLGVSVLVMIIALFLLWDVLFDRWLLHSDMLFKPEYYMNRRQGRFGSILLNPNYLGALVVLLFPPTFVAMLTETRRAVKIYLGVVLLALLFCIVETQSRAPLAAFAASILLMVFIPMKAVSRKRRLAGLALGLTVFAIFMPGFFDHAVERFSTLENETTEEEVSRASVWHYTRKLIAEHPWGGVGLGESQFLRAMATTDFRERYGRRSLDNPHNSYLQAAVYAGIPSVVVFLLMNVLVLRKATTLMWKHLPQESTVLAIFGLLAGVAGFLVSIYPDMHLFTSNVGPIYWIFLAMLTTFTTQLLSAQTAHAPAQAPNAQQLRLPRRLPDTVLARRGRLR